MKVNSLKRDDPDYPTSLAVISKPPKEIFWLGAPPSQWTSKPRVAIVGSRKVSAYGQAVTAKLASELAKAGCVIISGLAYGVDSIAHKAAIEAGGVAVVVLGTPLDRIYPSSHTNLARQIIQQGGTILSEQPIGSTIYKSDFLARNRIIAALSDLLLITEAGNRSGTLNTARFALEQGKTVAAVPGNVTSLNSEGTNQLIKSGALLVTETEDILFALNIASKKRGATTAFRGSPAEEAVFDLIKQGVEDQEEIATTAGLDGASISSILISLELAGVVKPSGGGKWSLS